MDNDNKITKISEEQKANQIHNEVMLFLGKELERIHQTSSEQTYNIENEYAKSCDIICSTIKSSGTGVDIKGLRCIINLEPFSSKVTCNQLAGRLREYGPDMYRFYVELIDIGFSKVNDMYRKRLKKFKEIFVSINEINYEKINK